jgi:uncharacterized integral membrane protein (TIGR00698 family)
MQGIVAEWARIGRELRPALPGLLLAAGVAVAARLAHTLIPGPTLTRAISEVFIAVLLGLTIRQLFGLPRTAAPGVRFALHRVLRLGIILLGLRLSLQDVLATGLSALLLILACVALALTLAYGAGRLLHIPARLAMLIGVGTAICGNTAIVATAPVIEAGDDEVSFAVATITLFGTLAVILYPLIGVLAGLTERTYGLWAGMAVNDTSQVVAAGAAFSERARDVATVVKLTRNTLLAPAILLIGLVYSRANARPGARNGVRAAVVPWFVLGFLAMVLLRTVSVTLGFLPQNVDQQGAMTGAAAVLQAADYVSKFAVLLALSAIGLGTDLAAIRRTGPRPLLMGLALASGVAAFALALALAAGSGRP